MPDMYHPSPDALSQLSARTLVMIIGPTAIGKSTIMNEVAARDDRFTRVSGFTTRQPRINDEPGMYWYYTRQQADEVIRSHQAVQFITHPTTGEIYGTEPRDYPGEYNLQDTISVAVDPYRKLPFQRTIAISLTTEPEQWETWLEHRFPTMSDDRTRRLLEAKQSIEWSLAQTENHHWLVNNHEDISVVAMELIDIVSKSETATPPPPHATKLLALVNHLLSYEQH